jgi:glutamyl-tRNA reductase
MTLMCWSLVQTALSPAQRGQLAVSQEELPEVLSELNKHTNIQEIILVSTCQRLEFYVVCEEPQSVEETFLHWCQQRLSTSILPHPDSFYTVYSEDLAAQHLFQVAAGLQSLVLGESEIMGQLRRAWNTASQYQTAGRLLKGLFSHALSTGRKIRHRTDITEGSQSLESLALEQIAECLQRPLSELRCLVIGTGQMGQAVLRQFNHRQVDNVRVINRSAPDPLTPCSFSVEPWHHLKEALQWAEAIIVCTAAPQPVVSSAHFPYQGPAQGSPKVIIDLSLPANVAPDLENASGTSAITVYPLSLLHHQLAQLQQRKRQGLKEVHHYLTQGWERYLHWRKERALAPFLTEVYTQVPKTKNSASETQHLRQRLHPLVIALKQAKTPHTRAAYQHEILYLIQKSDAWRPIKNTG